MLVVLKKMDSFFIIYKNIKKKRRINLNKACIDAINILLAYRKYEDDDPLFLSQRKDDEGKNKPLTPITLNKLVKSWCEAINLKGNYGSHTLRKTWGYHQRVTFSVGIPELMVCFNHSTQKQTLDYLCVQPAEIKSVYANEL